MLKGMEGVIRGYRPQVDWGGEGGSATIMVGRHNVHVATAGWRKRCLFILLAALLTLSVINLLLTIWILRRISFNAEGAGSLHVKVGGVKLEGIARIDHELRGSKIEAEPGVPLDIIGYYNISAGTVFDDGTYSSLLLLDSEGIMAVSKTFSIRDSKGNLIFKSEKGKTEVGSKFYTIKGDGGADLSYSLQTPRVLGDEVHEFRIESQTRSLEGSAAQFLRIRARDGDITTTVLKDATFKTKRGKFRFESPNVFFSSLLVGSDEDVRTTTESQTEYDSQIRPSLIENPTDEPVVAEDPPETHDSASAYQVCVCPSGRLFLTANTICQHDAEVCS